MIKNVLKKSKFNKKVDYTFAKYYYKCDFINKYNSLSIKKLPVLKKLIVELSLEDLQKAFIVPIAIENSTITVFTFIFIFLISNLMPYINFNKSNLSKHNFALKIIFNNEQQILNFLHGLSYNKLFKYNKNIHFKDNVQKLFVIIEKCPANSFFELESLSSTGPRYISNIKLNEFNFVLKFIFKLPFSVQSFSNLIKNYLFLNN